MKIILDNKEINELLPESLPLLIHGTEGSGASMYTIALAAKWFSQGSPILCLCGYPMAEEKFSSLVDRAAGTADFYTKDQAALFIEKAKTVKTGTILFVKNAELFDEKIFLALKNIPAVIISGDINLSPVKENILSMPFTTRIYFSNFDNIDISILGKYEGLVRSSDYQGITKLAETPS